MKTPTVKNVPVTSITALRRSFAIASIALAAAGLAGCADAGSPASTATAKPSATSTPSASGAPADALPEIPKSDAECPGGTATITENNLDVTIPGDCATVIVDASNTLVTVGAVQMLTINGAINKVTATSIESVVFTASGNIVETGNEPKVDDQGQANEVNVK
ncbi:DUF3060 domain-containing protein [Leifsonia sp. NCR5]|uniref:DUF3060 domain-containing protein n=1 Tax=Leifsonia sp. NCR5 TaxID=1978342 RepID=UPI000A190282|nr:DUF3060 domain-containing protein [Leifsonia sp. NCR5]